MHGGEISVRSEVGKGSVYTFRIPLAPEPGESEVDAPLSGGTSLDVASGNPPEGTGGLILVVEDNPGNLKLAREILASRGYRVLEAATGEEALDAVKFIRPDLILMDIQLPGMDGLTVTRKLKSNPATQDIPTIALTAHAMPGDQARALEAGCVGYIAKPIDTATFPRRVAEVLKHRPPLDAGGDRGKETA